MDNSISNNSLLATQSPMSGGSNDPAAVAKQQYDYAQKLYYRCVQEKDADACRQLQQTNLQEILQSGGQAVQTMSDGGELLAPADYMNSKGLPPELAAAVEDPFAAVADELGPEKYAELQEAIVNYPVVAEVAQMATFQTDGLVEGEGGPTDDKVPAKLSPGEVVLPAGLVDEIGREELIKMIDEYNLTKEDASIAVL